MPANKVTANPGAYKRNAASAPPMNSVVWDNTPAETAISQKKTHKSAVKLIKRYFMDMSPPSYFESQSFP